MHAQNTLLKTILVCCTFMFLFSCTGKEVLVKTKSEFPEYDYSRPNNNNTEFYIKDQTGTYLIYVPIAGEIDVRGVAGKVSDSLFNTAVQKKRVKDCDTLKVVLIESKTPVAEMKTIKDSIAFRDGDVITVWAQPSETEKITLIKRQTSFQEGARKVFTVIGIIIVLVLILLFKRWVNKP